VISGVSRNVFLLALVSFLTDISQEMLYPIVPLFLTQTLGASVAAVGWIEGLAETAAHLLRGVSGWLSDKTGVRKPFALAGYGISAFTRPMLALTTGMGGVLAARLLDQFGKGIRSMARDALIADSSTGLSRGRAFGFHRSADQLGATIGPLLALPLLAWFGGSYRAVFLAAFVPAAIGVAVLFLVREPESPVRGPVAGDVDHSTLPRNYRKFLMVAILFALGNSSNAFLLLRAKQLGASETEIVTMFALYNLGTVLSGYPAGILSDRLGRRMVVIASFWMFAAVYLLFGVLGSATWLWLLFPAYGIYRGIGDGNTKALAVDLAPQAGRGTVLGMLSMVNGLAALPASVLAGLLWERVGPEAPFLLGAATAALAGLLLAVMIRGNVAELRN